MILALVASLSLSAAPAVVTIHLKPASSVLLVDGKKRGTGEKEIVIKMVPGKHTLRVEHKGDAHEEEIVVKAGEKKTWHWEFEGATE